MTWKDEMNKALSQFVYEQTGNKFDVDEVRVDITEDSGGCDTCGWGSRETSSIDFYANGSWVHTFYGDWAELMGWLND